MAQEFTAAVTRALTAGATSAFARTMAGEPGLAPESIRDGILSALGGYDPIIKQKRILTPRARAALGECLSVLSFNLAQAWAGKEPV